MAKRMYISEEQIDAILQNIREELRKKKWLTGKVEYKQSFESDDRKATVYFDKDAWIKIQALVQEFSTEVQWHGLAERISENEFLVSDVIVFPHTVTSTTVESDQEKYEEWLNGLDDEVFNKLRFHGHSHVNMGCTPSGTDMKYRSDVVTGLPNDEDSDSFYIFMIFNKKGDWTGEIYDVKNNAIYDDKSISIEVFINEEDYLADFIEEAKKLAVTETAKKSKATKVSDKAVPYTKAAVDSSIDFLKSTYGVTNLESESKSKSQYSYYGDEDDLWERYRYGGGW